MASDLLIGFLLGAGAAGWVYSKTMRSTGNNTTSSLVVAGIVGVVILLAVTSLLKFVVPH